MTKKIIIIGSAVTASIAIAAVCLKKIRTKKLETYMTTVFLAIGLPNNMATDLAKIGIKYRFDHETRKKLFIKYCEEHFDEIDTDHLTKIAVLFADINETLSEIQ